MKAIFVFFIISSYLFSAMGQEPEPQQAKPLELPKSQDDSIFSHDMKIPGKTRSSAVWLPLASYFAPGLGQFLNGQSGAGFVYSGVGLLGLAIAASGAIEINNTYEENDPRLDDLDSRDPAIRRYLWGMKTYDLAGSLSLYHTFHTTVKFRRQQGDFSFLPAESETTDELMLAPFEFSNMSRWTTIIPLTIGLGLVIAVGANDDYKTRQLNTGDVAFSTGISYNAGVGEEALFRGWMYPLFVEAYGEENILWANLTQATIFGLAHLSDENRFPIAQLLMGYYWGWLAKRNGWSLKEAIFIHTWWDIIVFTAAYTQGDKKASLYVPIYQTQF